MPPLDVEKLSDGLMAGTLALIGKQLDPLLRDIASLRAENAALQAKLAAVEARQPATAVGIAGALKNANGVLVLTLTDGSTLETGIRDGVDGVSPPAPDVTGVVKAAVEDAVAALPPPRDGTSVTLDEVRPLVAEAVALIPTPKDGKSVDLADVEAMVARAVEGLPPAEPGPPGAPADPAVIERMVDAAVERVRGEIEADAPAPVTSEAIQWMIAEAVARLRQEIAEKATGPETIAALVGDAVAAIPPAEPGPPGPPADPAVIARMVAEAVAALPPPEPGPPGPPADPDATEALVDEKLAAAVAKLPKPIDGKSVDPEDVRSMVNDAVAVLPRFVEATIDRQGELVLIRSDGATTRLGPVVGRDADMGAIEKAVTARIDGVVAEAQESVAAAVAAIPAPQNGADGVGFDDLDLVVDERGAHLRFQKGEIVKEFRLPIVTDRGVWKEGTSYGAGDGVTWGGSFFIAQRPTEAKPETKEAGSDWRVAIKRGRDGSSAYDIARKHGFTGTEQDWLATLRSPPPSPPVKIGK